MKRSLLFILRLTGGLDIYLQKLNKDIYNTKTLLGMLDIALSLLAENNICSYCKICDCKDYRCSEEVFCKNFLFEGILKRAGVKISGTFLQ